MEVFKSNKSKNVEQVKKSLLLEIKSVLQKVSDDGRDMLDVAELVRINDCVKMLYDAERTESPFGI